MPLRDWLVAVAEEAVFGHVLPHDEKDDERDDDSTFGSGKRYYA